MTANQASRLAMYLLFKDYQAQHRSLTIVLPNYLVNSDIYLTTIAQIQTLATMEETLKKNAFGDNRELRESLIVKTTDYLQKLSIFAMFTNNHMMAHELNIGETELRQAKDIVVRDYAQIAYNWAQPLIARLIPYGINPESQELLLNTIAEFNSAIERIDTSAGVFAKITKQLDHLFKIAESALKNMDAAVEIVKQSQSTFYNGYKKARRIIELEISQPTMINIAEPKTERLQYV